MAEALLIIDVQNDFVAGGALAVAGGEEVVEPIARLARSGRFALIVATRDWHPPDHRSFATEGGPWPVHCVRGTPGAELVPAIAREAIDVVIDTGIGREEMGYSAFEGSALSTLLHGKEVDRITVVGLATDVCVLHSARDALREGLAVTVVGEAVRGIDHADATAALEELAAAGAEIV